MNTQQETMIKLVAELIDIQNDTELKRLRSSIMWDFKFMGDLHPDDKEVVQTIDIYFQAKDKAETLIKEYIKENELEEYCEIEIEHDIIKIYADVYVQKYVNTDSYFGTPCDDFDIQIRNITYKLIVE